MLENKFGFSRGHDCEDKEAVSKSKFSHCKNARKHRYQIHRTSNARPFTFSVCTRFSTCQLWLVCQVSIHLDGRSRKKKMKKPPTPLTLIVHPRALSAETPLVPIAVSMPAIDQPSRVVTKEPCVRLTFQMLHLSFLNVRQRSRIPLRRCSLHGNTGRCRHQIRLRNDARIPFPRISSLIRCTYFTFEIFLCRTLSMRQTRRHERRTRDEKKYECKYRE